MSLDEVNQPGSNPNISPSDLAQLDQDKYFSSQNRPASNEEFSPYDQSEDENFDS